MYQVIKNGKCKYYFTRDLGEEITISDAIEPKQSLFQQTTFALKWKLIKWKV